MKNIINFQVGSGEPGEHPMIEDTVERVQQIDSCDEDIAVVDNEDHVVKDDILVDEAEVQMNNVTPDIAMVLLGNVSLMLEYAAQI
jgi:hypothetical protein